MTDIKKIRAIVGAFGENVDMEQLVYQANVLKFVCHDDLKKKLLKTKDRPIVYVCKLDAVWGDGGDGTGRNLLGNILM